MGYRYYAVLSVVFGILSAYVSDGIEKYRKIRLVAGKIPCVRDFSVL